MQLIAAPYSSETLPSALQVTPKKLQGLGASCQLSRAELLVSPFLKSKRDATSVEDWAQAPNVWSNTTAAKQASIVGCAAIPAVNIT